MNRKYLGGAGLFLAGVVIGVGTMFFPYRQARKDYQETADMSAEKAVEDWEIGSTYFMELYKKLGDGKPQDLRMEFERKSEDLAQYGEILRDVMKTSDRISNECKNSLIKRISGNLEKIEKSKN